MNYFIGNTSNGWSLHLTLVPNGRAVKSLCGLKVWSGEYTLEARTPRQERRACQRCEKTAKEVKS